MILQALASYYWRIAEDKDSGIAPEGFQKQAIPFIIILDTDGRFKGLQDTRQGEGKKKIARICTVPKAVKKSINIVSNLLWGTPAYVFGRPKPDKKKDNEKLAKRAKEQQENFVANIKSTFPDSSDTGVNAVIKFLDKNDFTGVFSHPLWSEIEESGANVTFQLEGDMGLICQRDAVVKAISQGGNDNNEETSGVCLVAGEKDTIKRLHTAIKGVWGAQPAGANIVAMNTGESPAFGSYGKKQSYNAPVGSRAEHAYTTALNTLLAKDSSQRLQVGDASTVFWAEEDNSMEAWFKEFLGEPPKGQSVQDTEAIRALYKAPETGAWPLDDDTTKFYILGLSPNASRIAVRFWYVDTVAEIAKNIRRHFDDCKIVHGPKEPEYLSLFRLLVSTALEGKADKIQPNLSGEVMKAILTGTPYPLTLLLSALRRVRAEREVTYPRAALIKALLVRETRFYNRTEKEVSMSLDLENRNTGYLLGRLFAVLERAQELASPGINATIRDRFYGAASGSPVAAFPHLMKLKNHHIAKLENRGAAVNLEKQIGGIIEGIIDFPTHLSLQDQGRFAVGYYHQKQSFFKQKESAQIQ